MATPSVIVVSGPAGAGKTTLAHALATAVGCPAICRDEIKEGMVVALEHDYAPDRDDPLTRRASAVFFDTVHSLLTADVTVVAEAAFQDHVWRPKLEEWSSLGHVRLVRCTVDPDVGRQRMADRVERRAHADSRLLADADYYTTFIPVNLDVPTLDVDTTDGYHPRLADILAFATSRDR